MKNLKIIACVSRDGGLGNNGKLLWSIPEDMRFFKRMTMGSTVVMGSKTFTSIGRALPGRRNIVLSRQGTLAKDVEVVHSRQELMNIIRDLKLVFVIGGASLYQMFLDQAEQIYLTEVDGVRPADTFFPDFDKANYSVKLLQEGKFNDMSYRMIRYDRKK